MKSINDIVNEATKDELKITGLDINELIDKLQDALAEEYNAWYAYKVVCPFLSGPERVNTVDLYEEQAKDELEDHAEWLIERINQLGGKPDKVISPDMWNKTATHKYIVPESTFDVIKSIKQNIDAELGAIETYTELEKFTRGKDVATHRKIKSILADEQEHLSNLQDLLADMEK